MEYAKTEREKQIARLAPDNKFYREDAIEFASEYFDFEGMIYGNDGEELLTLDELEEKAIDYLVGQGFKLALYDYSL